MEHLRFIVNIFTFATGFAALALISLVYLKTYQRLIKYYFLWLIVLGLFVLQKSVFYYASESVILELWYSKHLIILFSFSVISLFLYFFIYMLFLVLDGTHLKIKYNLYLSLSVIPVFIALLIMLVPSMSANSFALARFSFAVIELVLSLIYIFVILRLKNVLPKIKDIIVKKLVNVGFVTFYVFIPLFVIVNTYILFNNNERSIIGYIYIPVFFITICVLTIIYCLKFLLDNNTEVVEISVSEEFMEDFGITEREKDIILLIMDGLSNDEIASRLAISPGTVKVYNNKIFQKIEVKNRTSLVKLITEYTLNRISCPWPG